MQTRTNDFLPMSQSYTDINENDFFSSSEVLNSTDTAKSYLSDPFKVDWEKYSSIEYEWEMENRSDYSFFISDFKDEDRRSSKSRSPSDFREHSLSKEFKSWSPEKTLPKSVNPAKSNPKVNAKRRADDESYFFDYKVPNPKKKSAKAHNSWHSNGYSNSYSENTPNEKADEILGLIIGKPPNPLLQNSDFGFDYQISYDDLKETDEKQQIYGSDYTSDFMQNTSKETNDNSTEGAPEKSKIKNYISTTSNGFATVLAMHGRDPQNEVHQILKSSIETVFSIQEESDFNWHLENILKYAKDKIEGKTTKPTSKGTVWRQNKVSNKTEIYNVFHSQMGDDGYTLAIKQVLRSTLEQYFFSNSFLTWVDEYYKTDKASSKSFFKNTENIKEIVRVYLSEQKWRSRFI